AVGQHDEAARQALVVRKRQRALERGQKLGAAASALLVDDGERALHVLGRRLERPRREQKRGAREEEYVERVLGAQRLRELAQDRLGRVERKAFHAAGHVQDEDVFTRWHVLRSHPLRRLDHQQELLLAARFVERQPRLDRLPREAVAQDEIPVASA